jgi:hypothetical protein
MLGPILSEVVRGRQGMSPRSLAAFVAKLLIAPASCVLRLAFGVDKNVVMVGAAWGKGGWRGVIITTGTFYCYSSRPALPAEAGVRGCQRRRGWMEQMRGGGAPPCLCGEAAGADCPALTAATVAAGAIRGLHHTPGRGAPGAHSPAACPPPDRRKVFACVWSGFSVGRARRPGLRLRKRLGPF